ncbi:MAG TPA: LuxR C-terminal-related transcriptional regulator [Pseudonocardiaceae bacterium]|nr:LuxR C-terminal-related transcriptional regulator [Pseudonocardiaceae bacterium]
MSHLPTPLTTFVGREPELSAIADALCAARLVTVVGPGGCGKTRLATEAAGRAADRWPDGVRWVDLASTGDPVVVPELVASAVGVLQGAVSSLARQIDDRRLLVCLDNCEHVLGAAADVAIELVRGCPGVTVLATSQEPLGVPGEMVWRVPPLAGDDAVALFRARSGQAASDDMRTACQRLDGIPLAIELAAAWSGTLSVAEILRGLDDRFALLVRGPRGVAARHQTLAASMSWSHGLLDEPDQVLFRRLGVFHGGCTLDTARLTCDVDDVRGGLRRLVDKSLVIADTAGSIARYRMLETIREYAVTRLAAAGELDALRDRHLATFLAVTEAAEPLLDTDKDTWRATIGVEQENMRAALAWGLAADDPTPARRLAAGLPWLWHLNGRGHEGLTLLRQAIDTRPTDRTALQARLLTGLALVADTTQPVGLEYDAAQAALEIATEVGDAPTAALARMLSAVGLLYQDLDAAAAMADQARDAGGFVADGATALLGIVRHLRDDHDQATPLLRTAIEGLTRRGDRGVASTALGILACGALYAGDVAAARELAAEGVRMARPLADYHRVGSAACVLATVETTAGRLAEAQAAIDPILRLVAGAEAPPFIPGLTRTMGELRLAAGDPADAITWFRQDVPGLDGDPSTLTSLAAALRATGDTSAAAQACAAALNVARHVGLPRTEADALEQQAFLSRDQAEDLHHEALAIRAKHGLWLYCVNSLEALAALTTDTEATRLLAACARARTEMAYPPAPTDPDSTALTLAEAIDYARRARGKRGRPATGWASLTPTEQSVVRLAATGLNNPEIGARLFMSRSTVKTHLSHVYAKLGVNNRTELATAASPHLNPD